MTSPIGTSQELCPSIALILQKIGSSLTSLHLITELVKALLHDYPNWEETMGFRPLRTAAQMGHKDIVELMLAPKTTVNAKNSDGFTPLHCAEQRGYMNVAALLLANRANVNVRNNAGFKYLKWAKLNGHKDIVELRHQHGDHE